jgi:hypothetical protein
MMREVTPGLESDGFEGKAILEVARSFCWANAAPKIWSFSACIIVCREETSSRAGGIPEMNRANEFCHFYGALNSK